MGIFNEFQTATPEDCAAIYSLIETSHLHLPSREIAVARKPGFSFPAKVHSWASRGDTNFLEPHSPSHSKHISYGLIERFRGIWFRRDGNFQLTQRTFPPREGGGGALRYIGGYIRSLSKFRNTPKALILGQKSTLIFKKRWPFPVKRHPFFYQNTDIGWTGTRILTVDVILLCLFSGSRLGSPVTSGAPRRQSRVYFVDCKGNFKPHTLYQGTKKYPSFTKSQTCGGLKKDPFFREIRNASDPPPPPSPGLPWDSCDQVVIVSTLFINCIYRGLQIKKNIFTIWINFIYCRFININKHIIGYHGLCTAPCSN